MKKLKMLLKRISLLLLVKILRKIGMLHSVVITIVPLKKVVFIMKNSKLTSKKAGGDHRWMMMISVFKKIVMKSPIGFLCLLM